MILGLLVVALLAARVLWLLAVDAAGALADWRARRVWADWEGLGDPALHAGHRDPGGDVWAVCPPCGYGRWQLYAPGAPTAGPFPYADVTPAATHPTRGFGGDNDRTRLADVQGWMRPWIEQVSGAWVVEMVESMGEPYGPSGDLLEYVIYARVSGPGDAGVDQ
ncbi:hypothetical protein [Parafrankia sp. FMc2]|uniref:hypothetical protein n=1 Tax=Parafrankia sp. FMc2 TaxID=3233196 RepID=UPI0034D6B2CE